MAEILSPPISSILLLARLRQYCKLRFVEMYWQCMRRRRKKRHLCQNGIWNGMVRKDLQPPKLLGFGKHGRTLFKTIAELVIVYHKKRKFSGHLLRKLRFFPDLRVKHPFDPVENVTRREFLRGKKTDLLHMRYMVVKLVKTYFKKQIGDKGSYVDFMPDNFKLLFSTILTQHVVLDHSNMQLMHPIFYGSDDRKRFLNAVIDLKAIEHSDVNKDMNSLFPEFCSKLLDAILHGLHRQEVHLGGKNLVDILFANPYDSTKSYRLQCTQMSTKI